MNRRNIPVLSENQRRWLIDRAALSSVNGMMICDMRLPDQPLIHVNPSFVRITGYGVDEVLGRNPRFLYGELDEQAELDEVREALQQERY